MKLTVLGKSPAWQDAGGACSGYLITEEGSTVLLDCGNGVFGKLRNVCDYVDVDAIFVSHMHADHFLDLFPYALALSYAPRQQPVPVDRWPGTDDPARPSLYLPPDGCEKLTAMARNLGLPPMIGEAFRIHEYDPDGTVGVGPLTASFCAVPHYTRTWAIEFTDPAGKRLTYGADCRPNRELIGFADRTDLLIGEATLPRPERTGHPRGHMTPAELGEHAALAKVQRLLVTHISDELDPEWALAQATGEFSGPTEIAGEGMEIDL
jgi:ribonuclease BN (tRNA processing enzyme)